MTLLMVRGAGPVCDALSPSLVTAPNARSASAVGSDGMDDAGLCVITPSPSPATGPVTPLLLLLFTWR